MKAVDYLRAQIKIDAKTKCWFWLGNYSDGRPRLVTGQWVHILLWEEHWGCKRGPRMELHHKCFNKFCVNPLHLDEIAKRKHHKLDHRTPRAIAKRKWAREYAVKLGISLVRIKQKSVPRWPKNITDSILNKEK